MEAFCDKFIKAKSLYSCGYSYYLYISQVQDGLGGWESIREKCCCCYFVVIEGLMGSIV